MNRHEIINDTENIHSEHHDDPREPPLPPQPSGGRGGSDEFVVSGEKASCFFITAKGQGNK